MPIIRQQMWNTPLTPPSSPYEQYTFYLRESGISYDIIFVNAQRSNKLGVRFFGSVEALYNITKDWIPATPINLAELQQKQLIVKINQLQARSQKRKELHVKSCERRALP